MGLNANSIKLLCEARESGVEFGSVLTLGRQSFDCPAHLFRQLKRDYDLMDLEGASNRSCHIQGFAEPFLRLLGAGTVASIDQSQYEEASLVHDMNTAISGDLRGAYDVVLDGGTLEHVFNFPMAMRNCMEMVRANGHLLLLTPINNYCGHGFFQFSPELFFRLFRPDFGFQLERIIAWEDRFPPDYYLVVDPANVKQRVELVNSFPVLLYLQARKIGKVPVHLTAQQSDYAAVWQCSSDDRGAVANKRRWSGESRRKLMDWVMRRFPDLGLRLVSASRKRTFRKWSLRERPGFQYIGNWSSRRLRL